MNATFKNTILASLAGAIVLGASLALAAPIRNTIERRQHPGRGFWDNDRRVATYRQPVETRQAYSFEGVPFKAGDMAKVTVNATSLKVQNNVLATVNRGEEFKVLDVQGPWVAAEVNVNGKPIRGWIYYNHLRPAK